MDNAWSGLGAERVTICSPEARRYRGRDPHLSPEAWTCPPRLFLQRGVAKPRPPEGEGGGSADLKEVKGAYA